MKRKGIIFLFILVLIALGFFREFVFVNINTMIYNARFNENYPISNFFSFIAHLNHKTLYIMKWVLTAVFIALFLFMQIQFSNYLFEKRNFKNFFLLFYLCLNVLASIAYFSGWIFNNLQQGYTFSRLFLGILQSPLPIIFLTPVFYFYEKNIS